MTEEKRPIESLDTQMLFILALMLANILTLAVLRGTKERQTGLFPDRDYSYLNSFPRVTAAITTAASAYFLYISWLAYRRSPATQNLWIEAANALALLGAGIKANVSRRRDDSEATLLRSAEP